MGWNPRTFEEACRLAAGRRAYNRKRRLDRARRISEIIALQVNAPDVTGRELARRLRVSEATASRDLAFVRGLRREFRRLMGGMAGVPADWPVLLPSSFRWTDDARGYELAFEFRDGVRIR